MRREIAQSFVPTALVIDTIEQHFVKDHVDSVRNEGRQRSLEARIQPHERSPAKDLAVDDPDSSRVTDHLDRKCPHHRIDPEEEPRTVEAGLQLSGQRCFSGARSAVESQEAPRRNIASHIGCDASSREGDALLALPSAFDYAA